MDWHLLIAWIFLWGNTMGEKKLRFYFFGDDYLFNSWGNDWNATADNL